MRVLILGEYGDRPEAALVEGLGRRGLSITAVYRPGNLMYRSLERAGLDPVPLVPRAKLDLRAVRRVRELITAQPFDIMHVFTSRMLFIGLLASRDCRRLNSGDCRDWCYAAQHRVVPCCCWTDRNRSSARMHGDRARLVRQQLHDVAGGAQQFLLGAHVAPGAADSSRAARREGLGWHGRRQRSSQEVGERRRPCATRNRKG